MTRFCKKWLPAIVLALMVLGSTIAAAQVAWVKNFNDALKQASREKRYLLLDVSASW
jgi:hypothetical protein